MCDVTSIAFTADAYYEEFYGLMSLVSGFRGFSELHKKGVELQKEVAKYREDIPGSMSISDVVNFFERLLKLVSDLLDYVTIHLEQRDKKVCDLRNLLTRLMIRLIPELIKQFKALGEAGLPTYGDYDKLVTPPRFHDFWVISTQSLIFKKLSHYFCIYTTNYYLQLLFTTTIFI